MERARWGSLARIRERKEGKLPANAARERNPWGRSSCPSRWPDAKDGRRQQSRETSTKHCAGWTCVAERTCELLYPFSCGSSDPSELAVCLSIRPYGRICMFILPSPSTWFFLVEYSACCLLEMDNIIFFRKKWTTSENVENKKSQRDPWHCVLKRHLNPFVSASCRFWKLDLGK